MLQHFRHCKNDEIHDRNRVNILTVSQSTNQGGTPYPSLPRRMDDILFCFTMFLQMYEINFTKK